MTDFVPWQLAEPWTDEPPLRKRGLRDDKFVISCAARTGSTMLVLLLNSHPDIYCHSEPYHESDKVGWLAGRYQARRDEALEKILWWYLTEHPGEFMYDVLLDHQDRKIAGFKYKTDEALTSGRPHRNELQPVIARDLDIKIVRLRRRDLLAQYVSHEVVRRTGVTLVRDSNDRKALEPFSIDPQTVVGYIADVLERDALASEAYRNHRSFELFYEDLTDPNSPVRDLLLDFLGVRRLPLSTNSQRVVETGYQVVSNLGDVIAALDRAGYSGRYDRSLALVQRKGAPH